MSARANHPAGRRLVTANVAWSGPTALVELVNRRGSIVEFRIVGPAIGNRRARLQGNDKLALLYDVPPGSRFIIEDGDGRILYDGVAPMQD